MKYSMPAAAMASKSTSSSSRTVNDAVFRISRSSRPIAWQCARSTSSLWRKNAGSNGAGSGRRPHVGCGGGEGGGKGGGGVPRGGVRRGEPQQHLLACAADEDRAR